MVERVHPYESVPWRRRDYRLFSVGTMGGARIYGISLSSVERIPHPISTHARHNAQLAPGHGARARATLGHGPRPRAPATHTGHAHSNLSDKPPSCGPHNYFTFSPYAARAACTWRTWLMWATHTRPSHKSSHQSHHARGSRVPYRAVVPGASVESFSHPSLILPLVAAVAERGEALQRRG